MPSPWRITQSVTITVAIALAGLSACKRNDTPVPGGNVAEALTLPSLGATAFDPGSLKGKPSLVMFVTPTCPHCKVTIPRGYEAAKKQGANVVAVFVAGAKQNIEPLVSDLKFQGVVLLDEKKEMIKKYDIKGVPYSLVLDKKGQAVEAFRGEQDESTLAEALADAK